MVARFLLYFTLTIKTVVNTTNKDSNQYIPFCKRTNKHTKYPIGQMTFHLVVMQQHTILIVKNKVNLIRILCLLI